MLFPGPRYRRQLARMSAAKSRQSARHYTLQIPRLRPPLCRLRRQSGSPNFGLQGARGSDQGKHGAYYLGSVFEAADPAVLSGPGGPLECRKWEHKEADDRQGTAPAWGKLPPELLDAAESKLRCGVKGMKTKEGYGVERLAPCIAAGPLRTQKIVVEGRASDAVERLIMEAPLTPKLEEWPWRRPETGLPSSLIPYLPE